MLKSGIPNPHSTNPGKFSIISTCQKFLKSTVIYWVTLNFITIIATGKGVWVLQAGTGETPRPVSPSLSTAARPLPPRPAPHQGSIAEPAQISCYDKAKFHPPKRLLEPHIPCLPRPGQLPAPEPQLPFRFLLPCIRGPCGATYIAHASPTATTNPKGLGGLWGGV